MHARRPQGHPRRAAVRRVLALLTVVPLLLATVVVGATSPAAAAPVPAPVCVSGVMAGPSSVGRFHGIAHPRSTPGGCVRSAAGRAATSAGAVSLGPGAAPPLLDHGGPVMSTPSAGNQVVVTPIYWEPSGFAFTTSYRNVLNQYLADVAADSDTTTNVFATMFQYSGSNGAINYRMRLGTPITDTTPFPTAGCTKDAGSIYADGSGYSTCLDDNQVTAETNAVLTANSLTRDLGHLYAVFLPKHVEACFLSDAQAAAGTFGQQACTINPSPSSAFCAYHSGFGPLGHQAYYATMPFPIYSSATGATCTTESLTGGVQHPNGDVDADVETSPLSHEVAEAITDPEGSAWYDSAGNENGDDCGYVYGAVLGASGVHFNQTINGHHYLTQTEFSNADYQPVVDPTREPCLQSIAAAVPSVTGVAPASGSTAGATPVTITGTGFPGATAVRFGGTPATFTIADASHIAAVAPAGSTGTVDITVSTAAGTSTAVPLDHFTYVPPKPTVTSVSPAVGPVPGGTTVTITGTDLTGATAVSFGASPATSFSMVDASHITAVTPAHVAGSVDVAVTTPGGTSTAVHADGFGYVAAPTISSVSPSSGRPDQRVTITGTELTTTTAVAFDGVPATFAVVDATHVTATAPPHAAGTVDITVTTVGGTSVTSTADQFTYPVVPAVISVSPSAGPLVGGGTVTISGTGLGPATSVTFGGASATFVVVDPTHLTATVPSHPAGVVDVIVTGSGGPSVPVAGDRFTYLAAPTVTRIGPTAGPLAGGTLVTILGTGFAPGATVTVGARAATSVVVTSSTRITARVPAHAAGLVDVRVSTAGGTSAALAGDRYRYVPRPAVTTVSPTSGRSLGGQRITVRGSGFVAGAVIRFGTVAGRVVSLTSTRIVVTTPRHAKGRVSVTVATPGGTSAARAPTRYRFV